MEDRHLTWSSVFLLQWNPLYNQEGITLALLFYLDCQSQLNYIHQNILAAQSLPEKSGMWFHCSRFPYFSALFHCYLPRSVRTSLEM
jgi:hypothetical protein